jgi:putative membrane-bound dehydrogenase-like protein
MKHQLRSIAAFLLLTASPLLAQSVKTSSLVEAGEGVLAPPDFKVSLVASEPMIANPAAMCVAPDGRIFVAEDYVHAEIKGVTRDVVKVLVGAERGGAATSAVTIAEDLDSVQGMAFHEGKLYIANSPYIDVLPISADNRPGEKTHLITGIGAGKKGFSPTHQASGLLVRDGWLYICHGDQGADVTTKKGEHIILDHGAIWRCRLDGSDLHIYAHGFRNIYGIGMDRLGNAFTRENDNDGRGYNCRSYHLFKGAYFGWPFRWREADSQTPPSDVLSFSRDQGHGSSTMLLWADTPAWPEPFRNVLLCGDWTMAKVMLARPEKKGATFDLPETPFIADMRAQGARYSFRPTALAFAPDQSLIVADMGTVWLHSRERIGRVLRVKYTGATPPPLAPIAATALTPSTSAAELMKKLASSDADERGRAALLLGEAKNAEAAPALLKLLGDADALVRLRAVGALSELKSPANTAALAAAFEKETDRHVRHALVMDLRASRDAEGIRAAILAAKPETREALLYALRDVYDEKVVAVLTDFTDAKQAPELRARASEFLGVVAKKGRQYIRGGNPAPEESILTESWSATPSILARLYELIRDPDKTVQAAALAALQKLGDVKVVEVVLADLNAGKLKLDDSTALILLRSAGNERAEAVLTKYLLTPGSAEAVRIETVRNLMLGKEPASLEALRGIVSDKASSPALVIAAMDGLARRKDSASSAALITLLKNGAPELKPAAARALGVIHFAGSEASVVAALDEASSKGDRALQTQALIALWRIGDSAAVNACAPRLLAIPPTDEAMQIEIVEACATCPVERRDPMLVHWLANGRLSRDAGRTIVDLLRNTAKGEFGYFGPPASRAAAVKNFAEYAAQTFPQWKAPAATAQTAGDDIQATTSKLMAKAIAGNGDATSGGAVFMKAACVGCHKVKGTGGILGPDLSEIGSQYARDILADSILNPSSRILDGYQQTIFQLKDREVIGGSVQSESRTLVTVTRADATVVLIPTKDIARRTSARLSPMPAGLQNLMTEQEFVDLVVYLESLKKN